MRFRLVQSATIAFTLLFIVGSPDLSKHFKTILTSTTSFSVSERDLREPVCSVCDTAWCDPGAVVRVLRQLFCETLCERAGGGSISKCCCPVKAGGSALLGVIGSWLRRLFVDCIMDCPVKMDLNEMRSP